MTDDQIEELEGLCRLAHVLARATAGEDVPPCIHSLARALETRLKTLSAGVHITISTREHA